MTRPRSLGPDGAGAGRPPETVEAPTASRSTATSKAERQLLLWTNAARVAPEEFENEYQGAGCSFDDFEADEQIAKAPLYIDLDLTEVSRWHSEQMEANDCFQHESCDGTNEDFGTRVARYYTETGMALIEKATFKSVLLEHYPQLAQAGLGKVENAFEPWGTTANERPEEHPLARIEVY
jgi:hypothetical protein